MVVRLGLNLATYPVYIYNQGSVIEKACMTETQITPYMRRYDLFTQAVTRTRGNHHQYNSSKISWKWSASVSNGFFIFSAKQSDGGSTAYLALADKDALCAESTKSKAESFVARKDPAGGFELLVFLTVTTTSGLTTTSTPTLKAIYQISGALKAENESFYRFEFTFIELNGVNQWFVLS
jgi:hypothetical protein